MLPAVFFLRAYLVLVSALAWLTGSERLACLSIRLACVVAALRGTITLAGSALPPLYTNTFLDGVIVRPAPPEECYICGAPGENVPCGELTLPCCPEHR